jgi:hypothetical protein
LVSVKGIFISAAGAAAERAIDSGARQATSARAKSTDATGNRVIRPPGSLSVPLHRSKADIGRTPPGLFYD